MIWASRTHQPWLHEPFGYSKLSLKLPKQPLLGADVDVDFGPTAEGAEGDGGCDRRAVQGL
eukprot:2621713-Rhodomonas_salina.1